MLKIVVTPNLTYDEYKQKQARVIAEEINSAFFYISYEIEHLNNDFKKLKQLLNNIEKHSILITK